MRLAGAAPDALPADTAAVVAAAHGRGDEAGLLATALRAGVPYVALVASRRRAAAVLAEVAAAGIDEADLARVSAPAGLDIGAATPAEVALSVHAEIVAAARSARPTAEPPAAEAAPCCHAEEAPA